MDEVIHHCLRELAFDGDFGCAVSRLRDFVSDFYKASRSQKLDDAFYAFIWSVIVQQPGVRVGILPEHEQTDVFIAPGGGTRRKGGVKQIEATESVELDVIADAAVRPLNGLVAEHGERLRIAVDPDSVSLALIGSHIRSAKLTPPVFTALQLVARGRDAGISTVDLSKRTGYDAKTCHYLISKLVELDLVEKRKKSGVGSHVIIHKYFFDRSPVWQTVLAEEAEAADVDLLKTELDAEEEGDDDAARANVSFEPIDLRYLSSLPVIRARIVKLLLASPHYTYPAKSLMTRIGFQPGPGKTDRRFFLTRLRELMAQGVLEKVQVPHPKRKTGYITCFRLLSSADKKGDEDVELELQEFAGDNDENILRLKGNYLLHRQIIDLVEASGTEGTTISALSRALCGFDRRIVELLLTRLEQYPPPPHLADLGICQLQENAGRERRFKYFTMANFHILAKNENISSPYLPSDMSHVGEFLDVDDDQFYTEDADLHAYVDNFPGQSVAQTSKGKTPQVSAAKARTMVRNPPKEKPEKIAKPSKHKNPLLANGTVKKGRPRKYARGDGLDGNVLARGTKRKREKEPLPDEQTDGVPGEHAAEDAPPPPKRARGRPRKVQPTEDAPSLARPSAVADTEVGATEDEQFSMPTSNDHRGESQQDDEGSSGQRRKSRRIAEGSLAASVLSDEAPSTSTPVPLPESTQGDSFSRSIAGAEHVPRMGSLVDEPVPVWGQQVASTSQSQEVRGVDPVVAVLASLPESLVEPFVAVTQDVTASTDRGAAQSPPELLIDPALLNIAGLISFDASGDDAALPFEAYGFKHPLRSPSEPPTKRAKIVGMDEERGRSTTSNLTQSRREKEFLQVMTEAGGLVNISTKEFAETHANLVNRLMKAGESVSSRATSSRVDKRTVDSTFNKLESRGEIKLITSSVSLATGSTRRVRVAYLPDTTEAELADFLAEVGRSIQPFMTPTPLKTVDISLDYSRPRQKTLLPTPTVPVLEHNTDPQRNAEQAQELFGRDEETIHEALLTEKDTVAQLYGFIPGKTARARAMHLLVLRLFDSQEDPSSLVSRNERVIHLSHFFEHISVSAFCSLVACLDHSDELSNLLETSEGPVTSLSALPDSIKRCLRLDKTRSQTRILDLLDILQALGLAVPLQPSSSDDPHVWVASKGVHPTTFDVAESSTHTTYRYWRFNTEASVFLWVRKDTPPRFWKKVSVASASGGESYWQDLETASTDHIFASNLLSTLPHVSKENSMASKVVKLLRRTRSWSTAYNLSWFQTEYLRRFIDASTKTTPMQDATLLSMIAWVTSVPLEGVKDFYQRESLKITDEDEKLRDKSRKSEQRKAEKRASLALRAASAKEHRERTWDELVAKVHPEPLKGSAGVRVRRVRSRFLQSSGIDLLKWEAEITQAIEEAKIAATKVVSSGKSVLVSPAAPSTSTAPVTPPVFRSTTEKSVEALIALQGPPATPRVPQKRKKRGEKAVEVTTDVRRRHRFQWNRDYDELARDASAIIKARCRNGTRLDWAALEQVFPAVPRNSVRQRVGSLKEQAGGEAYMKRLEDKWYEVWVQHRGTAALPDSDPESPSNFDMIAHVKFLRAHIDKTALRIGFVEAEHTVTANLLKSIADFEESWDVVEKGITAPLWDFMWSLPSEESREKQFLQQAFLVDANVFLPSRLYPSEHVHVAEATVKMTLGTPNELYDADVASAILKSVGEEAVREATAGLLGHGVLSKVVRDPAKAKPGRTLKISEINQNALGGSVSAELFQDASAYDEFLSQDKEALEWREWSLLATDGDIAALVELVSENKIELKVDTSSMKFAHSHGGMDWNSKKIDDDDIETAILVRSRIVSQVQEASSPSPEIYMEPAVAEVLFPAADPPSERHGCGADGNVAACRRTSSGPVDCAGCLQEGFAALYSTLDEEESSVASLLQSYLTQAGSDGLLKAQLVANFDGSDTALLPAVVSRLTEGPIPVAFWSGYTEVALVSSAHAAAWTAVIKEGDGGIARVFPRRWLDLSGMLVENVWKAALKAVMGVVVFRPGLTQAEMRWRLRSVYDRQEINEVLQHLLEEGYVKKDVEVHDVRWAGCGLPDDEEEKTTFWTVGEKHWYSV